MYPNQRQLRLLLQPPPHLKQPLLQVLTHHPRRQVLSRLRRPVHQQPPQLEIRKHVPSLHVGAASMVSHGAMRAILSSLRSGAKIVQKIVQIVMAFGAQTQIASDVCSSKIEMFDVYHYILDAVWKTSQFQMILKKPQQWDAFELMYIICLGSGLADEPFPSHF